MNALKRLAIGMNFGDLRQFTYDSYKSWCKDQDRLNAIFTDNIMSIEVCPSGVEISMEDNYYGPDFTNSIPIDGTCEVTLEQYEEFLKTYTKEQYEQEVREATVRLNELSTIAQGVLNEGVKLSKELGIEWTIELEQGTVVPELSQYVDWQSSTIDCAKYY